MPDRKTLLICIDGLDPAYLEYARTPTLDLLARAGGFRVVRSVLPSVTNVNNVSIITGAFPEEHGIASNYWYDPATGRGEFIETAEHLRTPTVVERASDAGWVTAVLVTKTKLLRLLGRGATVAFSAEEPPVGVLEALGEPSGIYSAEVDYWLFRALAWVLRTYAPDLAYCATTDYVMHMHGPASPEAIRHVESLDRLLGELLASYPDYSVFITADHGMRAKTVGIDLVGVLAEHGIPAVFVPPIKDRYVLHHHNMGGAGYLYLAPAAVHEATAALTAVDGVEAVYPRDEAAARFRLPADRIGDLFVLADPETVFVEPGTSPSTRIPVRLRSHGGLYESYVPLWTCQSDVPAEAFEWNLDIARLLRGTLLGGGDDAVSNR